MESPWEEQAENHDTVLSYPDSLAPRQEWLVLAPRAPWGALMAAGRRFRSSGRRSRRRIDLISSRRLRLPRHQDARLTMCIYSAPRNIVTGL